MLINYCRKYYSLGDHTGAGFYINADNFEYYLLLYIDNELSDNEKFAFEHFIESNPIYKNELYQLQRLKLSTEEISFNKTLLFKNTIITPENVESYYLQLIDEELTNEEFNLLHQFLETNPSIQAQLATLSNTKLSKETFLFNHSLLLKVNEDLFNKELNWSELLMLYLDNELTHTQLNFVENELAQNKFLQKEYALLKNTKAYSDPIIFTNKKSLYKKASKHRKIVPFWIRYVAAACVLAFLTYQLMQNPSTEKDLLQIPTAKASTFSIPKKSIVTPENNNSLLMVKENRKSIDDSQNGTLKNKASLTVVKNELNEKEIVTKNKLPRITDNNVVIANELNSENTIAGIDIKTTPSIKEIFISEKVLPTIRSLPTASNLVLNEQEPFLQNNEVTIFDVEAKQIDQKGRAKNVGQKLNHFFANSAKRLAEKSITIGGYEIAIAK